MKKLLLVLLGTALLVLPTAANPSEADQKWLAVVEKMVADGKDTVSTASTERAELAKKWAANKGYTASVAKTENGYQITFSKPIAQN
ncbi:MAG: hypothetical protein ACK45B_04675 [Limisphaerales bacterium]